MAGDDGLRHDRNALYLSTGAPAGAGGSAALVVPQPVPRHARQASLSGKHQIVIYPLPGQRAGRNQQAFAKLEHAPLRLEITEMTNKPNPKDDKNNPATPH